MKTPMKVRDEVRIVGTSQIFKHSDGHHYMGWEVQIKDSEGTWKMVTLCFGPASASSAVSIARQWVSGEIPSPLDTLEFSILNADEEEAS
jgi:hypothetical protein